MTASLLCSSVKHTVYFLFYFGIICRLVGYYFCNCSVLLFGWMLNICNLLSWGEQHGLRLSFLRLRDNQALVVFRTSTLLGIDYRGLYVAHARLLNIPGIFLPIKESSNLFNSTVPRFPKVADPDFTQEGSVLGSKSKRQKFPPCKN